MEINEVEPKEREFTITLSKDELIVLSVILGISDFKVVDDCLARKNILMKNSSARTLTFEMYKTLDNFIQSSVYGYVGSK